MADIDVTVGLKTQDADRAMRDYVRKAADSAQSLRESFDLAMLLSAAKAGFKFMGGAMREYAKESEAAKAQIDSITGAWAALKGEVGYGLASLLGGGTMPTAKDVRETAGVTRAATMGMVTNPLSTSSVLFSAFAKTYHDLLGDAAGSAQSTVNVLRKLSSSPAMAGGLQEVAARERMIRDDAQRRLMGVPMAEAENALERARGGGRGEFGDRRAEAELAYQRAMEQTAELRKQFSGLDTDAYEKVIKLTKDATLAEVDFQERLANRKMAYESVAEAQAWQRQTDEERRRFMDGMKRSEEDRRLTVDRIRQGDTLELAQREARMRAERDIDAIRQSTLFNPEDLQPVIDRRNADLADEMDAIEGFYSRKDGGRYRGISGGFIGGGQAGTLRQVVGAGPAQSGQQAAEKAAVKSETHLANISKGVAEMARGSRIAVLG